MKASNLTGMPVISVADGVKAGNVADLILSATSPQVTALVLKSQREQTILPFDSIRQIGPDAIMIDRLSLVRDEIATDGGDEVRRFTAMVGKEAAGDDGTYLGDLKDLDIDTQSGRVETMALHRGGMMGIGGEEITVPGSNLHAFGTKLLTVAPPAGDPGADLLHDREGDRPSTTGQSVRAM
ncbi:MAG: PRC-barrel domain-containing protein [Chloroflexota bacterium]